MFGKVRKTRSDCTVGTYEKKHDLPTGTIRNKDGRKARKDKTLAALRKENGKDYPACRNTHHDQATEARPQQLRMVVQ